METTVCLKSIPRTNSSKCKPFPRIRHVSRRLSSTVNSNKTKALTTTSSSSKKFLLEVARRCKEEFHPSVWDGHYIVSTSPNDTEPDELTVKRIEELKTEIRDILSSDVIDVCDQIDFIDKIQQLGVGYHFEAQIEDTLQHLYHNANHEDGNLYNVALRFRIFRQAGFYVSPGVFDKFKGDNDEFDEELKTDLEGLLSLYEASYLSIKGEDIMDEAVAFSKNLLQSMVSYLPSAVALRVQRALDLPILKRIIRVHANYYISFYEQDEFHNRKLMEFAKLDYNLLQKLHQMEIREVNRWWKEIDIVSKLPFRMRDRVVEGYAMMMAISYEPKYSIGRIYMSKLFGLLTVLDDTFDAYGTLEELQQLTDAISRWNLEDTDELPEYVKIIVVEVLNLSAEIEEEMTRRGQTYNISYFKSTMQHYVRCLMEEEKIFNSKTVPPFEHWLQNSSTTGGAAVLIVGSILDTWSLATTEALDWSVSNPKIINSSGRIGRLVGDIHTFKSERESGNMASSIKCYMKENNVEEEEEAIENIKKVIDEEWKEMNQECLKPTLVPMNLLKIVVNVGQLAEEFYLYGDGYTHSKGHMKEIIDSLLVNPVPSSTV